MAEKKTILITGGAGFVGHHCIEHILKNTNWDIVVLDCLSYAGNMNRITEMESFDTERVKFIWHDLKAPISEITHKLIGKLDYLIHFAAESHVDRSLEDSASFAASNVVGTAHLLEYLKRHQPQCKTLVFSTDEVFGPAPEGIYFKENDPFRPSNPYSASKVGEEMMAFAFAHAFGLPISIVRSMNIIGERQYPEKFLPKTIRALLNNEKIVLHGQGRKNLSSRCWIHARNVADGLLFLLDRAKREEFYHIAGEERTVLEVADWVCQVVKGRSLKDDEIEFVDFHSCRPGHDRRYSLDDTKLKNMGWVPKIPLEASLKKAVEWSIRKENRKWLFLD